MMAHPAEKDEGSMEEILASIRKIISEEEEPASLESNTEQKSADIIELTDMLTDEENIKALVEQQDNSAQTHEEAMEMTEEKKEQQEETIALEEVVEESTVVDAVETEATPEDVSQNVEPSLGGLEDIVSETVISEAAQALSSLNRVTYGTTPTAEAPADPVGGQTVDDLMREVLRPILRDWIDANLPSIVRYIVTEQVEKIVKQMAPSATDSTEDVA